ncbi:hypothetical protein SDC9_60422 [bioreactor metagenome]|uniref:Teichuronic acid biosynthesis protein TuaE n=2 Tax=root TaxID=1 RepID=A0A4R8LYW6_9BACT|nr:O-antigen ligase family protein [Aminivibrio pyruvatiphilus]TDY52007.1 teichuronic acid biosynthesis protein TuaE [Aminivibrio pyruvatiphilus]
MKIKNSSMLSLFVISAFLSLAVSHGPFYLFHAVAILYVLLLILRGGTHEIKLSRLALPLLFVVVFSFFSTIWAPNAVNALRYSTYLLIGFVIFVTLSSNIPSIDILNKIFRSFLIISSLDIFVSLLEIFTSFRPPVSPYSEGFVPTGFHWNPNNLAAVMVLILPFFLFSHKFAFKYIGSIAIVMIIFAIDSRGNLLALAFLLLLWFFFYMKSKKRIRVTMAFCLCVFGLIVLPEFKGVPINILESKISGTIHSFSRYVSFSSQVGPGDSISTRRFLIYNGIKALKDTFGWGLGAGGDQILQGSLGSEITSMHAFWLEILVNLGISVGGIFILWYFYIAFRLFYVFKKSRLPSLRYYSGSLSLGLLGFSVGAMSASSVIYVLPMWLALGLGCATIKLAKKNGSLE